MIKKKKSKTQKFDILYYKMNTNSKGTRIIDVHYHSD